jgi:hypothetical protein
VYSTWIAISDGIEFTVMVNAVMAITGFSRFQDTFVRAYTAHDTSGCIGIKNRLATPFPKVFIPVRSIRLHKIITENFWATINVSGVKNVPNAKNTASTSQALP